MRSAGAVFGLSFALIACASCTSTPPAGPPRWHVSDGFLRDPEGRAVIMHGANLSGAQKNAPYFGFHTLPDFQRMRSAWGMNSIRLIATWAAVEPTEGAYDDAYLDALATRVQWAQQSNLFVVVDMHDDVYGEGFVLGGGDGAPKWTCDASNYQSFVPASAWYLNNLSAQVTACYDHFWQTQELQDHYKEAWRRVAARLVSFDNVIGFDVMNEPYWGSQQLLYFEPSTLQPFYEQIVPAVREIAPNWIAYLEPSTFRNLGGTTRLVPFSFGDVVYSPHSYDRDAESGMGFDPSHRAPLMANIDALASEAKGLNAGLFIGEYGGMANNPGIADYMTATYDGAGQNAASSMIWSYDESDNYGLLNPDGTEKTALLDVVVRPYPERVAGTPQNYSFDATTSTFAFTYTPDRGITAPTLVSVPDRLYPKGYTVDCGGCAFSQSPNAITITAPAPGNSLTVTIHP